MVKAELKPLVVIVTTSGLFFSVENMMCTEANPANSKMAKVRFEVKLLRHVVMSITINVM